LKIFFEISRKAVKVKKRGITKNYITKRTLKKNYRQIKFYLKGNP
tara:strand:+ start:1006 stop:1140 length:135 start_codon:yes stop_codon:yes gene_type:complete